MDSQITLIVAVSLLTFAAAVFAWAFVTREHSQSVTARFPHQR